MKRILAFIMVLCLLAAPALAEDEAQPEAGVQQQPGGLTERPMGLEGGARGERPQGMAGGGRGQGGMAPSEPDEALQAILGEVQQKYQLLTFTDPVTGFEMQYELFVPEE